MKHLLFLMLMMPFVALATGGYMTVAKGLEVRSQTEKGQTTLIFKVSHKERFDIGKGDTMLITLATGETLPLIVTKTSSPHTLSNASGSSFYNGVYVAPAAEDISRLKSAGVSSVSVAGLTYAARNGNALMRSIE